MNALTGFEFEQQLPVIKDSEPDLDRHLREFESILDCHAYGNGKSDRSTSLQLSGKP